MDQLRLVLFFGVCVFAPATAQGEYKVCTDVHIIITVLNSILVKIFSALLQRNFTFISVLYHKMQFNSNDNYSSKISRIIILMSSICVVVI